MTWACERFQQYLLGQQNAFILQTDHKALLPIMNAKDLNKCPPRLQRLKIRLARFNYQVQYVLGKELLVADAVSRTPVENTTEETAEEVHGIICQCSVASGNSCL